ncbi:ABC transporter permease [Granulicella mallensis]|uniref:Binding-protein-dependent transport systems inner membrane component n=1 Tax=Granulicella mallensis (strain ATCC BAA-1857 / DSM 23137 / MP5ACTX8) TaxID=682795 RepID=G8NYV1_GRAMM|nr:ABC transporter permease subunit [Granulicella mallensis]AEU34514.1 binding-protein-dependent transport systems inner membrane component [Granulicella mallensis MP5ACTX8]
MQRAEQQDGGIQRALYQVCGFLLLLAAWQIAGKTGIGGKTLPALTDVFRVYTIGWRRALLLRAAAATVSSAGIGLLLGATLGCLTAFTAQLLPALEPGLDRLAVVVNALPAIALGPVLVITAGREATPALLAAIPVFFLIYVAATSGLRSADRRLGQFFQASGASCGTRFRYLDAISALPALLNGMKLAVTTAMIGAVVGEWFGAPTGLGIVILNTMQNFQIPLMWAAVLVVAGISLTGYALIGWVERIVERRMS